MTSNAYVAIPAPKMVESALCLEMQLAGWSQWRILLLQACATCGGGNQEFSVCG